MIAPLGLGGPARLNKLQLEQARARAVKARELVASGHFGWWREVVEEGLQKLRNRLLHADLTEVQTAKLRGKILGVMQILRELDMMAAGLENVEAQLAQLELDRKRKVW